MPDTRSHRGPDPADAQLFCQTALENLRCATADLCWLLTRGYAIRSAVELVGNRYSLAARQRLAVARCACSESAAQSRGQRELPPGGMRRQDLWLDGLNILTGLEVALSGGVVLLGCDGCCRDIAGVHRHYRNVEETVPAIRLVGDYTESWGIGKCRWLLDKPVSNSGRLKTTIHALASERGWDWEVELVYSPDSILAQTNQIVATGDSVILDRCQRWLNLVRHIVAAKIPNAHVLDLSQCLSNSTFKICPAPGPKPKPKLEM